MANEDKATRYQRARRRTAGVSLVVDGLLLVAALAPVLPRAAAYASGYPPDSFAVAAILTVSLAVLRFLVLGPVDYWGAVVAARRYGGGGTTATTYETWLSSYWRRAAVTTGGVLLVVAVVVAARLIAEHLWWLLAALALGGLFAGVVRVLPGLVVWSADVVPLTRPVVTVLLQRLAERAGVVALDVLEWKVGGRQSAVLVGAGTRYRVLLTTALLDSHSDEEVEVVVAHELAHHVRRDSWWTLLAMTTLIAAGLFLASWALSALSPALQLQAATDARGVALVGLVALGVQLAGTPLMHALSRAQERHADRLALTWTRNPPALVRSLKRLGAAHLAEERPSLVARAFFGSHPSVPERIAAAEAWQPSGSPSP